MISDVKIIRTVYGSLDNTVFREMPSIPTISNQIVYVWGEENQDWLNDKGYETRLQNENDLPEYVTEISDFIRKLISLKKGLEEFGEVLHLDWDCRILKPFDETFYGYLNEKPIQCPIYSFPIDMNFFPQLGTTSLYRKILVRK